jgi:uncharacterized membrane protein YgdD (TMEM256/DUF423 family)
VFLINVVPIAVILWLLARAGVKDTRRPDAAIDWLSAVMCTLGLGLMVFALIEQPRLGWSSPAIWLPLVVGAALFAGFIVRQRFTKHPVLPLDLFTVRNFWTGNVATTFIYGALALNGFVVVVYLQQGAGLPRDARGSREPTGHDPAHPSQLAGRGLGRQMGAAHLHDGRPDHDGCGGLCCSSPSQRTSTTGGRCCRA